MYVRHPYYIVSTPAVTTHNLPVLAKRSPCMLVTLLYTLLTITQQGEQVMSLQPSI